MLPYAPWIVWSLPLIIAFTHPITERISKKLRDFLAVASGFTAAIFAASMIPDVLSGYTVINGVYYKIPFDWIISKWIPVNGIEVTIGTLVDPLSVFMANVVAWVSSFILLYSLEYMHGDRGITRYWMLMNLFIGFMELLVLGDSLIALFFGWEGVGFASYTLIGYWYLDEKKYWIGPYPPTHAGMKAFITTRIGDVGLLVAILTIFIYSGTFNFMQLANNPSWAISLAREGILGIVFLLMLLGPIGKSAQFPLHEWLPEAMAGPTTVSALIHAATMVKAGVYFLARFTLILYSIFYLSHGLDILSKAIENFYIAVVFVGAFTAFLAASQGMVADQIKKVLAYSTVSQLGYMFAAFGVTGLLIQHQEVFAEAYMTGLYHLLSHALFKSLLFLAAGAIGHSIETYMLHDMGGLKKYMPKTYLVMLIGGLGLAGIPPFNGFWSKDSILHVALTEGYFPVYLVLAITAILTVFYTFRMIGLAFYGKESKHVKHLIEEGHKPHDPGKYMLTALYALALGTIFSGFFLPGIGQFFKPEFLSLGLSPETILKVVIFNYIPFYLTTLVNPMMLVTGLIIFLGIMPSYYVYIKCKYDPVKIVGEGLLKKTWIFLYNRWYINKFYYLVFVDGTKKIASNIFRYIECNGGGNLLKGMYMSFSNKVRKIQTGYLRINMSYMALAVFLIILTYLLLG